MDTASAPAEVTPQTAERTGARRARAARFRAPREHGFWTMLLVVQLSALSDAGFGREAWLASASAVALVVLAAGALGRAVRKSESLQLLSSAVLGILGMPAALMGGVALASAAGHAGVWAVVFLSSALLVRGAFGRSRRHGRQFGWCDALGIGLAISAVLVAVVLGGIRQAAALSVAAVGLVAVSSSRPTVKQMKPMGLALAGIAVAVLFVLSS